MTQNFGKQGEQLIVNYLQDQNFTIITQNYKQFFGEIDIIARKNNIIAFVEVKSRRNTKVSIFELVSFTKQQKIIKTAKQYIAHNFANDYGLTFRFDVALVECKDHQNPEIIYIPNAF